MKTFYENDFLIKMNSWKRTGEGDGRKELISKGMLRKMEETGTKEE